MLPETRENYIKIMLRRSEAFETKDHLEKQYKEATLALEKCDQEMKRYQEGTMSNSKAPETEPKVQFDSGAVRSVGVAGEQLGGFPLRYDLILANVSFMQRMAKTFGEGSTKYGDENWKQGMPEKSLVNHAMAHIIAHLTGDQSEDHVAHATWNFMAVMWHQDNRPDLLDLQRSAAAGKAKLRDVYSETPTKGESNTAVDDEHPNLKRQRIVTSILQSFIDGNLSYAKKREIVEAYVMSKE